LQGVEAAPPASEGNRTPLSVEDQDKFLGDVRSIQPGLSIDQVTTGDCYYGDVTSGEKSMISRLARGKDIPVGVGPMVVILEGGGGDEDAARPTRASQNGDEGAEDAPASKEMDDQAPSTIIPPSQEQAHDQSHGGNASLHGLKRRRPDSDEDSANRRKMDGLEGGWLFPEPCNVSRDN
jgi:hypothetical protein